METELEDVDKGLGYEETELEDVDEQVETELGEVEDGLEMEGRGDGMEELVGLKAKKLKNGEEDDSSLVEREARSTTAVSLILSVCVNDSR